MPLNIYSISEGRNLKSSEGSILSKYYFTFSHL